MRVHEFDYQQKIRDSQSKEIEIHLTEYRALREEQKARLTGNYVILNVIVIIVGALFTVFGKVSTNEFVSIMLVFPILTTPLTLMFYDNQLMIYRVGGYFTSELYPKIRCLTDYDIFKWEDFHQRTSRALALVAFGRNFFFVLLPIAPIIAFIIVHAKIVISNNHAPIYTKLLAVSNQVFSQSIGVISAAGPLQLFTICIDFAFFVLVSITWCQSGILFMGKNIVRIIFRLK